MAKDDVYDQWRPSMKWFRYAGTDTKDPEAKQELIQYVLNNSRITTYIANYIEEELRTLESRDLSEDEFDNPNWQNKQAFHLGQRRALKNILEFLPPKKRDR